MSLRTNQFDSTQCPLIKSQVINNNGMLVFQDTQNFEFCAYCLELENESFNDQYESQYPSATPEELDELDSINNFNQWQTFVDFENSLGFNSLRAKIENEHTTWLENTAPDTIDFSNDPDVKNPIVRIAVRSLFNENGYVKIGNDTIHFNDWGDKSLFNGCSFYKTAWWTYTEADDPFLDNRMVLMKVRVKAGVLNSNLVGEIKHYKLVRGRFRPRRAKMKVQVTGTSFAQECNIMPQLWNKSKGYKKRRNLQVNDYIWFLWREALTDDSDPRWPTERCVAHGFLESDTHYYPVFLK